MKELKSVVRCVVPFIVTAIMVYPLMAIVGASFDPFMWERSDRMFYAICAVSFGWALMLRVLDVSREDV